MRLRALWREATASGWAAKVPTLLVALVVAAMCFVALTTVGTTAANEAQVQAKLEAAGARQLSITDSRDQGFINPRTLSMTAGLSSVETAVAIGLPRDVTNGRTGPGSERVAAWPVQGDLTKVFQLVRGRMPRPGEAVVSSTALRKLSLAEPIGYVVTDSKEQYPIVGAFQAMAAFGDMGESIIVNAADQPQARELRVVIATIADVRPTQNSILTILAPADPQGVYIESPSGLADTAQELGGQLAGFGRSLLLLILGVGAFFVATVVLSDVLVRRRDLGRRRTLGITRSFLTALVTLRTIAPAATGALVGTISALIVNVSTGTPIPIDFAQAVGVLAVITAAAAAIPPAWYAAQRDPVDVMRTP